MHVPRLLKAKYNEIEPSIIEFCEKHLDEEYALMSLKLLEKLCWEKPSPLLKGKADVWACGIVYAIGSANLLFDRTQPHYMRATAFAEKFGLGQNTAGTKAGFISRLLNISPLDPEWTISSRLKDNPLVWMIETKNGFTFDVRNASGEIQKELFDSGLITSMPSRKAN